MKSTPNPYRSAIHDLPDPPEWTDAKARTFARAVLAQSCQLADVYTLPRSAVSSLTVADIPHDLHPEAVAQRVRHGLARVAAQLAHMQAVFAAYGAEAFMPAPSAAAAPPATAATADRQRYARAWIDAIHARGEEIYRVGDLPGAELARVTRKDLKGQAA